MLLDVNYKLLCYNKPKEKGSFELTICVPLSLFLKCFELESVYPMTSQVVTPVP